MPPGEMINKSKSALTAYATSYQFVLYESCGNQRECTQLRSTRRNSETKKRRSKVFLSAVLGIPLAELRGHEWRATGHCVAERLPMPRHWTCEQFFVYNWKRIPCWVPFLGGHRRTSLHVSQDHSTWVPKLMGILFRGPVTEPGCRWLLIWNPHHRSLEVCHHERKTTGKQYNRFIIIDLLK